MPQFKATHDGQEIEVEITDDMVTAAGFIPKAEVASKYVPKANNDKAFAARLEAEKGKIRSALLEDAEVRQSILSDYGIPLDEEGNPKLPEGGMTAEDVKKQLSEQQDKWRQTYEKQHVAPLQEQIEKANQQNAHLRDRMLVSDLIQAAKAAGVRKDKFDVLPGAPPETAPIVSQLRHRLAWAPDAGMWALVASRNQDGTPNFEINSDPNSSVQYAGPEALFQQMKDDRKLANWFEDNSPGSSGLGNPATGGGSNTISMAKYESMSFAERNAFMRKGGTVEE